MCLSLTHKIFPILLAQKNKILAVLYSHPQYDSFWQKIKKNRFMCWEKKLLKLVIKIKLIFND